MPCRWRRKHEAPGGGDIEKEKKKGKRLKRGAVGALKGRFGRAKDDLVGSEDAVDPVVITVSPWSRILFRDMDATNYFIPFAFSFAFSYPSLSRTFPVSTQYSGLAPFNQPTPPLLPG